MAIVSEQIRPLSDVEKKKRRKKEEKKNESAFP